MGYYVTGFGQITIKRDDEHEAYKAMCALNDNDEIKRGGSFAGGTDSRSSRPEGLNYHPHKWFSWLDPNYPSMCFTFLSILDHLGFEIRRATPTNDSTTYRLYYESKVGQEKLFLEACAPYLIGEIEWEGEDGERWRNVFAGGEMITQTGKIVYS